jgi:hypothetical protein
MLDFEAAKGSFWRKAAGHEMSASGAGYVRWFVRASVWRRADFGPADNLDMAGAYVEDARMRASGR